MSAHVKIAALRARIAADTAKIAELEVLAANEVDTSKVAKGTKITFEFGRGDSKTTLFGTVQGVKREEGKAAIAKVLVEKDNGDVDLVGIFLSAIKAVEGDQPVADPLTVDGASGSLLAEAGVDPQEQPAW